MVTVFVTAVETLRQTDVKMEHRWACWDVLKGACPLENDRQISKVKSHVNSMPAHFIPAMINLCW